MADFGYLVALDFDAAGFYGGAGVAGGAEFFGEGFDEGVGEVGGEIGHNYDCFAGSMGFFFS